MYFILRTDKENFTATQNYLMKEILKDKDAWRIIRFWRNKPFSWRELLSFQTDDREFSYNITSYFVRLLGYGLIEMVDFQDGIGIRDVRWKY